MGTLGTRTARARKVEMPSNAAASATAYHRLHQIIVGGVLAPGSPLVERELCARLGVSRTPIRAALLRLQQEGLVTVAAAATRGATRRMIVAPLTAGDLRELFLMAGALEASAARALADRGGEERTRAIAQLTEASRDLRAALANRPPDLIAAEEQHRRFHAVCPWHAAGPRLRQELGILGPQIERYQRVYGAAILYAVDEFGQAHERIVAAIRAADAEAAERAVIEDWRLAAGRFCEMAAMLGDRGNW